MPQRIIRDDGKAAVDPHHSGSSDARVTQVALPASLPSYSVVGRWSLGLTTQIGDHLSHHGESDAVSPSGGRRERKGRKEGREGEGDRGDREGVSGSKK